MQLQHLFTFSRLKNRLLKYDDASDITAYSSGCKKTFVFGRKLFYPQYNFFAPIFKY